MKKFRDSSHTSAVFTIFKDYMVNIAFNIREMNIDNAWPMVPETESELNSCETAIKIDGYHLYFKKNNFIAEFVMDLGCRNIYRINEYGEPIEFAKHTFKNDIRSLEITFNGITKTFPLSFYG